MWTVYKKWSGDADRVQEIAREIVNIVILYTLTTAFACLWPSHRWQPAKQWMDVAGKGSGGGIHPNLKLGGCSQGRACSVLASGTNQGLVCPSRGSSLHCPSLSQSCWCCHCHSHGSIALSTPRLLRQPARLLEFHRPAMACGMTLSGAGGPDSTSDRLGSGISGTAHTQFSPKPVAAILLALLGS